MRILFLGDVVGREAREELCRRLPDLRQDHNLDCIIVNAENAANGFGLTANICKELYDAGVDCITTGNHVWDQREIISYIDKDDKLLRPVNFPAGTPGKGVTTIKTRSGQKVMVVNVMGRLFMDALDDPFAALRHILDRYAPGKTAQALVVDVHAETTSEKMSMGHFCDGKAALVVGTHTHVPTADLRIFPKGTAYQTDAGMCGCYDSVIGMDTQIAVARFVSKVPGERMRPATENVGLAGVVVEVDSETGLAKKVWPFREGGGLEPAAPPTSAG